MAADSPRTARALSWDPRVAAVVGGSAAAALTVAVVVHPELRFAYNRVPLRVAVETSLGLVSVVLGYLALGRFRSHRRLSDLLVLAALTVLAVVNFGFVTVPRSLALPGTDELVTWGTPAGRGCAAVLLAVAALFDSPTGATPRRLVAMVVGIPTAIVTTLVVIGPRLLPDAPDFDVAEARRPVLSDDLIVWLFPGAGTVVFGLAAWGFLRRYTATKDTFSGWLGAGCTMMAVANAHYALFPALSPEWFYTGDLVRFVGYAFWFVGAGSEISTYWARLAIADERRRLARDLHDGLAQELAFVTTQSAALARRAGGHDDVDTAKRLEDVNRAGQRALDEARRAIAALTQDPDQPLEVLVAQAAEDVAARAGLPLGLRLTPGLGLGPERREASVRIVREAVTNVVRHAGATEAVVELVDEDGVVLRVRDDGAGFDPGASTAGFGLTSMRERAAALGADVGIRSGPQGTTVELRWP